MTNDDLSLCSIRARGWIDIAYAHGRAQTPIACIDVDKWAVDFALQNIKDRVFSHDFYAEYSAGRIPNPDVLVMLKSKVSKSMLIGYML